MMLRARKAGFTLVEIMLVVIIIAVLAAMVVPRFAGRTEQAKIARARADMAALGVALDMYELDMSVYPANDLKDLLHDPGTAKSGDRSAWQGPYIKQGEKGLIDPWGHEYGYKLADDKKDYALTSLGPDGKPGNDDITNKE